MENIGGYAARGLSGPIQSSYEFVEEDLTLKV